MLALGMDELGLGSDPARAAPGLPESRPHGVLQRLNVTARTAAGA